MPVVLFHSILEIHKKAQWLHSGSDLFVLKRDWIFLNEGPQDNSQLRPFLSSKMVSLGLCNYLHFTLFCLMKGDICGLYPPLPI